jgi:hypothetical protein
MPSLADALAAARPNKGGPSCHLCDVIAQLPKDDRTALTDALNDRRMAATMIAKALTDSGYDVGVASVRRHRRGECAAAQNVG